MALRDDEMNIRRQRREEMRRRQRQQMQRIRILMVIAAVLVILAGVGIWRLVQEAAPAAQPQQLQAASQSTRATDPVETTVPRSQRVPQTQTITLTALGDLNITNTVVDSGMGAMGYDYTRAFMDVQSLMSAGDMTIVNLEGGIYGEPYGTESASAPRELLTSLRKAGVDLVQMANSYSIYNGLIGLNSTLSALRTSGLEPVGAYSNPSEFQSTKGYTMVEVKGIKIAVVAFTKGLGGMGLPAGNDSIVNILYEDYDSTYRTIDEKRINSILNAARSEKPDIIVGLVHWGSENNETVSSTQKRILEMLQKKGVSIVIGTHPHLVQEISFDEKTGNLVAYSLGDFYGDGVHGGTNYSIVLNIEITKDMGTGITRVTGYDYVPIYTLKGEECDGYHRVVRIKEAMAAYNANFVDKITADCYSAMAYALQRIESRVSGKG